jgi:hypothetical protein
MFFSFSDYVKSSILLQTVYIQRAGYFDIAIEYVRLISFTNVHTKLFFKCQHQQTVASYLRSWLILH